MSNLLSPKSPKSPEEENQELVALDLQRRLLDIVEFQEAFDLMKTVRRQEEKKQELDGPYYQPPKSDADEDDDESAEFSFYKFSVQHFQGYMSHRHITQRLRKPLLKHDDEGDALVRGQGAIRDALLRLRLPHTVHLSHCRRVWLRGGLSCVSWKTCRSQKRLPVLSRPSLGICLTDRPGSSATWWNWTRYQLLNWGYFLDVRYCKTDSYLYLLSNLQ